jgi:hypothetical protein
VFEPDLVFVRQLELDDPKFDGVKKGVSTRDRLLATLGAHDAGATSEQLAVESGVARKTVQNYLTELAGKKVVRRGRLWHLIENERLASPPESPGPDR